MKRPEVPIGIALSLVLIAGSWLHWLPLGLTETLGFVTGAACVYLVVREHVWNFPVGIANNVFFFVLFFEGRLYGDAWLQVVYLALGAHGWYLWLHGGENRSARTLNRAPRQVLLTVGALILAGTAVMTPYLRSIHDPAPLLDALTTCLSLGAQWLLNRKSIENWYLWMTADVIYVYLDLIRGFPLTAALYLGFLGLCIAGLKQWNRSLQPDDRVE